MKGARKQGKAPKARAIPVPERVSRVELARILKCTDRLVSYHVEQGHLSPSGDDRKYDLQRAMHEWANRPRTQKGARPKPGRDQKVRGGSGEATAPARGEFAGLDPDTHWKTVRALREELKLNIERGGLWDAKTTELRVASFVGLLKSTIEAFPAQEAPGIAARVEVKEGRIDEGSMYREIKNALRKTLERIAGMDLSAALAKDVDDDNEDDDVKAFEEAAKTFDKKSKKGDAE